MRGYAEITKASYARRAAYHAIALAALAGASDAQALPIGFGTNESPNEYSEVTSDHFNVYFDARVPTEGAMTLNALEAARPHVERWLGITRQDKLPVVTSAVTDNASFANFIADSVELQTMGQGTKDLAWHEYTHSTMWRHYDNLLGPAGAILNLPWMPAWLLEGVAEMTSVSVGSDVTAGIERYQALTGEWPTYDRLHSLYAKYGFFERGYSTAGALVRYLVARGGPNDFPTFLNDTRRYSMPWWWPWAMVPWNGFMPTDEALKRYVKVDARKLYLDYKKDAAKHWKKATTGLPFLVGEKGERKDFSDARGMASDGKSIRYVAVLDGSPAETDITFDEGTGWATSLEKRRTLQSGYGSFARVVSDTLTAGVAYERTREGEVSTISVKVVKSGKVTKTITRNATVYGVWQTAASLAWLEQEQATTRFCIAPKTGVAFGEPVCEWSAVLPKRLRVLGAKPAAPGSGVVSEVWLSAVEERLHGNHHAVWVFDATANAGKGVMKKDALVLTGQPTGVAFAGETPWIVVAERARRTLRSYKDTGVCDSMIELKDHVLGAQGLADGSLALALYAGERTYIRKLPPAAVGKLASPCDAEDAPTSPIQEAIAKGGDVSLDQALKLANAWAPAAAAKDAAQPSAGAAVRARVETSPPIDKAVAAGTGTNLKPRKARWRGRPVFAFPWIGADDALGPQVGIISVPLMDEMQNETVRATFLYGAASRFPYQEIAITSGRFVPTLTLTGYRQQTYNGRFIKRETGDIVESYLDEKGARLEADYDTNALGGRASLGAGIKYAHLKPYIGPEFNGHGWLAEPGGNIGLVHGFWSGRLTLANALSGRVAPESMNDEFDYNQLGASSNLSLGLGILNARAGLGVEGSRTRGRKLRDLKEVYRPLKTYIPGSGGGFNQNSFPLGDAGTGLFSPLYGDTQARAKATLTAPLIADLDKIWWIIYLERLDFTAFYNYGGAWTGVEPPRGWDHLVRAHGYNIDLQMENKGVRFNIGLGIGQVVGRDFEAYMTTGFDALF